MVVSFIFVAALIAYFSLVLSFILEDYTIGMLSAFGIMVIGIYIAIYNVESINNVLTQAFAIISMGLGAYVLINGSIEKINEII